MSLWNRRFFIVNASEQHPDGTIDCAWLRCRRFDLDKAAELEELIDRVQGAYTPTDPDAHTPDDGEGADPTTAPSEDEGWAGMAALQTEVDRYVAELVVAVSYSDPANGGAYWQDLSIVLDEADEDEGEWKLWVGRLPIVVRQEVVQQGLAELLEATARVARFRSAAAAPAGDDGAGDGDAPLSPSLAG